MREGGYLYELPGIGLLLSDGRRRVSSLLPSLAEKACGPAVLTREPHLPSHLPRSLLGEEESIVHATAGTRADLAVTGFGQLLEHLLHLGGIEPLLLGGAAVVAEFPLWDPGLGFPRIAVEAPHALLLGGLIGLHVELHGVPVEVFNKPYGSLDELDSHLTITGLIGDVIEHPQQAGNSSDLSG